MENKKRWYYTPQEVAKKVGWDAQYIRLMARNEPEKLPFEVLIHGNRVQIPRAPFDTWFASCCGAEE